MSGYCGAATTNGRVGPAVKFAAVGALLETLLFLMADVLPAVDVDCFDDSITPPTPAGCASDAVFPAPTIERLEAVHTWRVDICFSDVWFHDFCCHGGKLRRFAEAPKRCKISRGKSYSGRRYKPDRPNKSRHLPSTSLELPTA